MPDANKILVGKIVAPQGIRGEVRVQTYTNTPTDFKSLPVISSKFAPDDFKFVRQLNPNSTVIIAKIRGFEDRTAVEALRGTELFIERNALPQTDDDEYYQADLIGFDVIRNNIKLGTVSCFQNYGAGDIIELDTGDMVSFIGANVDMNNHKINIR